VKVAHFVQPSVRKCVHINELKSFSEGIASKFHSRLKNKFPLEVLQGTVQLSSVTGAERNSHIKTLLPISLVIQVIGYTERSSTFAQTPMLWDLCGPWRQNWLASA
jgi:hypothetical protein